MLLVKKNIDISSYHKLVSFLKNNSVGHEAKKAMVLSKETVIKFIAEAPNEIFLMTKVCYIDPCVFHQTKRCILNFRLLLYLEFMVPVVEKNLRICQ